MPLTLNLKKPKQSLNKSYLKNAQVDRTNFDNFKTKLNKLLKAIDETESEENVKNHLADFLKDTFYKDKHEINTKGRTDLVIHAENIAQSPVNVLLEVKKPSNKTEMITTENLNAKALQELMLYYLRERETENNTDLKYLIITNIYEFFIFEASDFERLFHNDTRFLKDFKDWQSGKKTASTTDFFYTEIAKPFLENLEIEISATYFNIQDYQNALESDTGEEKLLALYKLFSPEHLLKTYSYDSNKLNQGFYEELLHIIGLEEVKEKGKKVIKRKAAKKRDYGSLLENTFSVLKSGKKIEYLPNPQKYGDTPEEQLYNISLELVITWVNRILFLKLLEGQLINFHKGDASFRFLDSKNLSDFDDLYKLFFEVLALKPKDRKDYIQEKYHNVPYLNSSLFDVSELEKRMNSINVLDDAVKMSYFSKTVLVDTQGKKETGNTLVFDYLLRFLGAYDFSAEGQEKIQEQKKELINASVLGLIFEKINGYKDGSFYTPGFITMYMARETLRKTVLDKFNATYQWDCKDFTDLNNHLLRFRTDLKEANDLINAITVCDPAVGSGHFLVSVLNEFLAIKSDLNILIDKQGNMLGRYHIETDNDELALTYGNGEIFEYQVELKNGKRLIDAEIQRVQETIFQEKRHLIENCLFGVDINPNSVQICKLRLWIELLKHTFYKVDTNFQDLEVLPNLDMKILEGNSLIPTLRQDPFFIDWEKGKLQAVESTKEYIDTINDSVEIIRKNTQELFNLQDAEAKQTLMREIENAKIHIAKAYYNIEIFKTQNELNTLDPKNRIDGKLSKKEAKQKAELEALLQKHKNNHFEMRVALYYRQTISMFDWKIMFSDILGTFKNGKNGSHGFDIVIGNPPYFAINQLAEKEILKQHYWTYEQTGDIYGLFYEKSFELLKKNGLSVLITSNKWMRSNYGAKLRNFLLEKTELTKLIDFDGNSIFSEASVDTNILYFKKNVPKDLKLKATLFHKLKKIEAQMLDFINNNETLITDLDGNAWKIAQQSEYELKEKIEAKGTPLENWNVEIYFGIKTGFNKAFVIDEKTRSFLIEQDAKNAKVIKPLLRGRDVRKHHINYQKYWLINTHNGIKDKNIPPIDVKKEYPSIYKYLEQYQEKLEKRQDKGNHWTNLRNCAYLEEFEKPKLIYPDIADSLQFALDEENYYLANTLYFLNTGNKYLLAVLNSKLMNFYYSHISVQLGEKAMRAFTIYIKQLPIPQISKTDQKPFIKKVEKILSLKRATPEADTLDLEAAIDAMVYELYGLSAEEIEIVENR